MEDPRARTAQPIDVAFDDSPAAAAALAWAAAEGALRGVPVRVLHVDLWSAALMEQPEAGDERALEADVLGDGVAAARAAEPAARVEGLRLEPPAGPALVEASRRSALLVVGASGRGRVQQVVLGSVSRYCVEHARCPVVVVRAVPDPTGG